MAGIDRPYFRKKTDDDADRSYLIVERRNGETTVTRKFVGGKSVVLSGMPQLLAKDQHQFSVRNGFVGNEARLRYELRSDAEKGVPINYVKTHETVNYKGEKVAAYRAEFLNRKYKNKWLRANNRVDFDASYSDPAPSQG